MKNNFHNAGSASFSNPNQALARFVNRNSGPDLDPLSEFWRGAPSVIANRDSFGKPVPDHATEIFAQWTRDNLYFLFICPYSELNLKPRPRTDDETYELWNWDVAEVFVGSDFKNIRKYKEFEVSPQGEWVDLDIDWDAPDPTLGWTWKSGFEPSAWIDASRKIWHAFMRIPYSAVDDRPATEDNILRINFYRSQGVGHQLITWQPTNSATFHVPEAFGTLKLVK